MNNNVKNSSIVGGFIASVILIVCLIAPQIKLGTPKEFVENIMVDKSKNIAIDLYLSMEKYNCQKEQCLITYRTDVLDNFDKYLAYEGDSLVNEIKRNAEIYVNDAYEELFKKYDNTAILANVSTKYNYNFKSKEEFYKFCVNTITYEVLTEITKQINIECIIRCSNNKTNKKND